MNSYYDNVGVISKKYMSIHNMGKKKLRVRLLLFV